MHDGARVGGFEHVEHLDRDGQELALAERRRALDAVLQRLAVEQLHHDVGRPLVGARRDAVVVEDLHDAGVVHLVRGVPLAQEALAHLGVARQAGVQDLDRRARPVAVPPLVHRGHAADAEHALERPLVAEHGADAFLRLEVDFVDQTGSIVAW